MKPLLIFITGCLAAVTLIALLPPGTFAQTPYFAHDSSHNPLDVIPRGSIYEQSYLRNFVGSSSEAETRSIMAQIDVEVADAPNRKFRIDTLLAFDFLWALLLVVFYLLHRSQKIGAAAKHVSIDIAARGLNAVRGIRSFAKNIGSTIDERSRDLKK